MAFELINQSQDPNFMINGGRLSQLERQQRQYQEQLNVNREEHLKEIEDGIYSDLAYDVIVIVGIIVFLCLGIGEQCDDPIRAWLVVSLIDYGLDLCIVLCQVRFALKNYYESIGLLVLKYLLSVPYMGWLIYGNVLYYTQEYSCGKLTFGLFCAIILGYFEMLKCLCITIFVPAFYFYFKRQAIPNWAPSPPGFIEKLARQKFNPVTAPGQDLCPICLIEYKLDDEIITLSCSDKHYFHASCVIEWLKKSQICPLCKKEVSAEDNRLD